MKNRLLLICIPYVILTLDCAITENVSGIWQRAEVEQVKLTEKKMFSWGEQAYNPLGTLNIDLEDSPPFLSAGGIVYNIKQIHKSGSSITITIIDYFSNNKKRDIVIEIMDNNTICVKNDVFYSNGNSSRIYTRVSKDTK